MDLEKIKSAQWYRQGAIAIPWFIHEPYIGSMAVLGEDEIITYSGENNVGYLNKTKELELCNELIKRNDLLEHIFELKKKWDEVVKEKLELLEKDFSKINNEELIKISWGITKKNIDAWALSANIEPFDPWGEEIVEKEMEKYNLKLNDEKLAALTSPDELIFSQEEKIKRVKLKENPEKVEEHLRKYFYIKNGWGKAEKLNEEYFLNSLNGIEEEVRNIKENIEKIRKRKEGIMKKMEEER